VNTVAWVLILVGALTLRQVSRGRTLHLGEDLSDALLALVRGDSAELSAVLARTGTGNAPVAAKGDVSTGGGGASGDFGPALTGLAAAVMARGQKAKGYRWGGTGPDYYDCSGLVWRGLQDIGYTGARFSTATIRSRKGFTTISSPAMQGPGLTNAKPGDIVLWPAGSGGVTGHMGVMTAPNRFYSARSVRTGIGESSISGFRKTMPIYLRYKP
jgi:cell wall-associated NlpC family hydrolase